MPKLGTSLPFQKLLVVARRTASFSVVTSASFSIFTKDCRFESFGPDTDTLFKHPLFEKINPQGNPTSHDCCVRRVPISQLQPHLVDDARDGGTALIEALCAGMWGGYGYAVQRNVMRLTKSIANQDDLWLKSDLQRSKYEPGTIFTNHFQVLSKSPSSIIMRGCINPRQATPTPQPMDNILELVAEMDESKGIASFKLKFITFSGTASPSGTTDPFGGFPGWLHMQYSKLLIKAGTDSCLR